MAYQSPENAQKLRDMPRVATNNADPARSLIGRNPSTQSGSGQVAFPTNASAGVKDTDMSKDKIIRMLQGFAAGTRGEGLEFVTQMNKQDKLLGQERKQAALADLSQVGNMLNNGYTMEAEQLLVSRLGSIEKLGGDTSHTRNLLDIVRKGDIKKATTIVNGELNKAYMLDVLKRPPSTDKGMTDYQAKQVQLSEKRLDQDKNTAKQNKQTASGRNKMAENLVAKALNISGKKDLQQLGMNHSDATAFVVTSLAESQKNGLTISEAQQKAKEDLSVNVKPPEGYFSDPTFSMPAKKKVTTGEVTDIEVVNAG